MINLQYCKDQAVNVNYQDETGMSALHYAVQLQNLELVNLLVKNFADIRCQNSKLQSPLHLACKTNNFDIYRVLIDACYQASDCLDCCNKVPLEYTTNENIIEYTKNLVDMLYTNEGTVSTTDFKRIGLLGKGAYAEVFLVRFERTG